MSNAVCYKRVMLWLKVIHQRDLGTLIFNHLHASIYLSITSSKVSNEMTLKKTEIKFGLI